MRPLTSEYVGPPLSNDSLDEIDGVVSNVSNVEMISSALLRRLHRLILSLPGIDLVRNSREQFPQSRMKA